MVVPMSSDIIPADEAEALGWYAKSALNGHADAQCIIATMYAEGDQVARNDAKASYWFKQSAVQGHAAAEFQMGLRYYSGGGVSKDPRKAFNYYQRAALQGHARAQFSLGITYTYGAHIQRDEIEAYAWFTIAAEGGHPDAATLRQSVELLLSESKKTLGRMPRLRSPAQLAQDRVQVLATRHPRALAVLPYPQRPIIPGAQAVLLQLHLAELPDLVPPHLALHHRRADELR